jgi:Cu/Ag efflux pump CusA
VNGADQQTFIINNVSERDPEEIAKQVELRLKEIKSASPVPSAKRAYQSAERALDNNDADLAEGYRRLAESLAENGYS